MKSNGSLRSLLRSCQAAASSSQRAYQYRLFSTSDTPNVNRNLDSYNDEILVNDLSIKSSVDRDTFLFGEMVSFDSCGLRPEVVTALEAAGKLHPTIIQAKAIGAIGSGADVIVGAETGSGKTLAYLLPIINGILKDCAKKSPEEMQLARRYPTAIIVVPSKELCKQVHRMASEIIRHLPGEPDISIGLFTNILERWPYAHSRTSPHIAVCTPAFLANFVKGPNVTEEGIFGNLRQLVLDEADMLLDGSFQENVDKILKTLRLARREMVRSGEIQADAPYLQNIVVAATLPSCGLKSVEMSIGKKFPSAIRITTDHLHKHHPRIEQTFIKTGNALLTPQRMALIIRAVRGRVRDPAGTPREKVVIDPLEKLQQTMVFVNTASVALTVAASLRHAGLDNVEYHKSVTDPVAQESLRRFRAGEVSVLVCTDHAARGLDLPDVRHVVQAEFATNVVQYLHRIGRASRAGVVGQATNIYDDRTAALVDSILSASGSSRQVDQSFSRRRGFTKKVKKGIRAIREIEEGKEGVEGVEGGQEAAEGEEVIGRNLIV